MIHYIWLKLGYNQDSVCKNERMAANEAIFRALQKSGFTDSAWSFADHADTALLSSLLLFNIEIRYRRLGIYSRHSLRSRRFLYDRLQALPFGM